MIFPKHESRCMALYPSGPEGSFMGFRKGRIWNTFHSSGYDPIDQLLLKICSIFKYESSWRCCKNSYGMQSCPMDFPGLRECSACCSSSGKNGISNSGAALDMHEEIYFL